jgi:hypothetical protein
MELIHGEDWGKNEYSSVDGRSPRVLPDSCADSLIFTATLRFRRPQAGKYFLGEGGVMRSRMSGCQAQPIDPYSPARRGMQHRKYGKAKPMLEVTLLSRCYGLRGAPGAIHSLAARYARSCPAGGGGFRRPPRTESRCPQTSSAP